MTTAVRELAQGRPAPPIRITGRDEVGELARAFAAMSQSLASVDEQRRELLANVGHELRTPVAALRAQVENLADGVRAPDPTALAELLGQVERLGDLLTDFLDLARVDGGATVLARRPVPVTALVSDVVAQVAAARPDRSIEILVTPADLIVDADPHRLGQVLTNLLDNATRHAPEDGVVRVRAGADAAGGLILEVTDNGPGIPPDRWETVFERFRGGTGEIPAVPERFGAERPSPANGLGGGTGLGLAIARWAVALHAGQIAVVPSETGGCRIRVQIPPAASRPES
jgi:signal transduction histidine kinase